MMAIAELTPNKGDLIAVWFSCGAASAVAAKKTIEKYGNYCQIRIINTPIKEEHPDNRRFLADVEQWLGWPVEIATSARFPESSAVDVWNDRKGMSFPKGAPCTTHLKRDVRAAWEAKNNPRWNVLGFTFEEKRRHERFLLAERDNALPILIESKITKDMCYQIIKSADLRLPEIYNMGYPNANCIGCVKATSPTYWNHVRRVHPQIFADRAAQSRKLGAKLVRLKGSRIYLDELPPTAEGEPMRNMDFECGLFCEDYSFTKGGKP